MAIVCIADLLVDLKKKNKQQHTSLNFNIHNANKEIKTSTREHIYNHVYAIYVQITISIVYQFFIKHILFAYVCFFLSILIFCFASTQHTIVQ